MPRPAPYGHKQLLASDLEEVAAEASAPESYAAGALRRRLVDGALTVEEQERFDITETVMEMVRGGRTREQIAEKLGWKPQKLAGFMQRSTYRTFRAHILQRQAGEDIAAGEGLRKSTQSRIEALYPKIPVYLERCFREDPNGEPLDEAKAMFAVQWLGKASGLDQPRHSTRPVIQVHIETIQAVSANIREDSDAALAAAGSQVIATVKAAVEAGEQALLEMDNGA